MSGACTHRHAAHSVSDDRWHDRSMARVQGWPDDPHGSHLPEDPKPAVDIGLNCRAVVLVVGTVGILVLVCWVLPHTLRLTF